MSDSGLKAQTRGHTRQPTRTLGPTGPSGANVDRRGMRSLRGSPDLLGRVVTNNSVNSFGVILGYYFDTNLGLLEDKAYYSDYYDAPFDFVEITD